MNSKSTLTGLLLVAFLGLFVLSACASPVGAQTASEQPHTISVTGSGIAYGKPDIAVASVGVQSRHPDAGQAVTENSQKMDAVIAALKALGIAEEDIQTTNFSVYVQQDFKGEGQPASFTYVADNTVTITVRDLNKVGDVLGDVVAAGANNIYGVSYSVSDFSTLESAARQKAMADAKARAEQLAQNAGVTLDQPMTISEFTSGPIPFAVDGRGGFGGAVAQDLAAVPVSSGQIQVTMQINVTYIIK